MDKYYEANKQRWNELAPLHYQSPNYAVSAFLNGTPSLSDIELQEVGNVLGKNLLHLQCHFGIDTLSWALLGANVTGVDFSESAISIAQNLATDANIPAKFIHSDIYDLADKLSLHSYDIIFVNTGSLVWLHDIQLWAKIVASLLKVNGFVYVYETHPITWVFAEGKFPVVSSHYFTGGGVQKFDVVGSYATASHIESNTEYLWHHTLADIITALASAGLHIDFMHEHPSATWQIFDKLVEIQSGVYGFPEDYPSSFPLMFSLKATMK